VEVRLTKPELPEVLKNLDGVTDCRELNGTYILQAQRPPQAIVSLVKHLEAAGNELLGLEISTPSLEDVFIELTGRRLRD
jgi:ABC-2 type transport system ATP-binding protein